MALNLIRLLQYAVEQRASDIHITVGYPPIMRIHGQMRWLKQDPLTEDEVHEAIYGIMTERQIAEYEQNMELDFGWRIKGVGRFRTNVYNHLRGEGMALRVIPDKVMGLDQIKAPESVFKLSRKRTGLVLVTGPTGSGKSTTLAAIVDLINRERRGHVLTVEDPIEFVHKSKNCLINQREVNSHTRSFSAALRAALREDPDVILVGEMRDLETISLALTAAETGHLVLGTLHTSSAVEAADRVIDVFPSTQHNQIRAMFANTLEGVIAQKLIPLKDGKGRVAAMEIMLANSAVRNLIRDMKTHQLKTAIQTNTSEGMQTNDQALMRLLEEGLITLDDAMSYADEVKQFEEWAGSIQTVWSKRKPEKEGKQKPAETAEETS